MRMDCWLRWAVVAVLLVVYQANASRQGHTTSWGPETGSAEGVATKSSLGRDLLRNKKLDKVVRRLRREGARKSATPEATPKVAGGTEAPCGRYTYMVSLRDSRNYHKCGGVLVAPRWVLTAAHCVDPDDQGSLGASPVIVIGACHLNDKFNEAGAVETLLPVNTVIYERWEHDALKGGDIALLELGEDSNHTHITLPSHDYTISSRDSLVVLGWGQNATGDAPGDLQQGTQMAVIPRDVCSKPDTWGDVIKDSMLCAIDISFKADTCEGDSGGPMLRAFAPGGDFADGSPDLDVLFGITSFGEKGARCGESIFPAVYTSVTYYVDWINNHINGRFQGGGSHTNIDIHVPGLGETPKTPRPGHDLRDKIHPKRPIPSPSPTAPPPPSLPPVPPPDEPTTEVPETFPEPDVVEVQKDPKAVNTQATNELLRIVSEPETPSTQEIIGELIAAGAEPNGCCGVAGRSALHGASVKDNGLAVTALVLAGARVDERDDRGQTPLHLAAFGNAVDVTQILVDAGADKNAQDVEGQTPLHDAASRGSPRVVEILLRAGANSQIKDQKGKTPFNVICDGGCKNERQQKKLHKLLLV